MVLSSLFHFMLSLLHVWLLNWYFFEIIIETIMDCFIKVKSINIFKISTCGVFLQKPLPLFYNLINLSIVNVSKIQLFYIIG
jgi:hypothetical protein